MALLNCEICGYDLTMVFPTDEDNFKKHEKIEMTSKDSKWKLIPINGNADAISIEGRAVVGRVDSPLSKWLNESDFVSRKHAQLFVNDDDELFVMDASTNGTFVNGVRISKLDEVAVAEGDEIRFADVAFKVVK
jgi:hypothetical protein